MFLAIIIACSSLLAQAQTPLRKQTKDRDYCADDDPATMSAYEMLQCARGNGNWVLPIMPPHSNGIPWPPIMASCSPKLGLALYIRMNPMREITAFHRIWCRRINGMISPRRQMKFAQIDFLPARTGKTITEK